MGSSAQNSSGVHWCRRRVRSNDVPEKVWEALVQSQVKFNRVPEKVPEKVPGRLGSGEGSREGSGEGQGGFGAEPGSGEASLQSQVRFHRVRRRFRRRCGRLWQSQVKFNRVLEKAEKFRDALVQSQVRCNRVPKKVPEKVWEAWCRARSSSTGFRRRFWRRSGQQGSGEGSGEGLRGLSTHGNQAEVYRGCFAARCRKICKNTTFRLLGIPRKLIYFVVGYPCQILGCSWKMNFFEHGK